MNHAEDIAYALAAHQRNQSGLRPDLQNLGPGNPAQAPLTSELAQRLAGLREDLGSALEDLAMLNERLFGPTGEKAGNMAIPQGPGIAGGLTSQLDDLRHVALNVSALARGLNGRI